MFFLKSILFISIFTLCTGAGFYISKRYIDREKELLELLNISNIIECKIKFTKEPLANILEDIANLNKKSKMSEMLLKISVQLKRKNLKDAWTSSVEDYKEHSNLKEEDIKLIKNLGNMLGKTDVDGQINELSEFSTLLKKNLKEAEIEKNKNSKMYRTLGSLVGLALIIVLW